MPEAVARAAVSLKIQALKTEVICAVMGTSRDQPVPTVVWICAERRNACLARVFGRDRRRTSKTNREKIDYTPCGGTSDRKTDFMDDAIALSDGDKRSAPMRRNFRPSNRQSRLVRPTCPLRLQPGPVGGLPQHAAADRSPAATRKDRKRSQRNNRLSTIV